MKRARIKRRSTLRRHEPTAEQKYQARLVCYERAEGRCQICNLPTDWDFGQLHHWKAKRRWGWMESSEQKHMWLCGICHSDVHNAGGKPCPPKQKSQPED